MAAFAVSAYASTFYRAGSKPFNPVLGETYECVRPDRGFRFISEQVALGGGTGPQRARGPGRGWGWGLAALPPPGLPPPPHLRLPR